MEQKQADSPKTGARRNAGKPISTAEFRRLWYDMRVSMEEIVERTGVTHRTLTLRAKALGFTSRKTLRGAARQSFDEEFPAFWIFGVSLQEMAEYYGVTTSTVCSRASRLGLTAEGRKVSKHRPGRTIDQFREFQAVAAAARAAGLGRDGKRNQQVSF